jgi:hypothetical protein
MMNELTEAIVGEIQQHHHKAERHAQEAKCHAEQALEEAVMCGNYLEQARGMTRGQMLGWLRDNVPDISPERAKAYMSLFNTRQIRESHNLDHRQLILLGVVGMKEQTPQEWDEKPVRTPKVESWVGSIRAYLGGRIKESPPNTWTRGERENLVAIMKPIIQLYQEIEVSLGEK